LLEHFQHTIRVLGRVLDWVASCLFGQKSNSVTSSITAILCGIPPGSVLGPVFFLLDAADAIMLHGRGIPDSLHMRTSMAFGDT